MLTFAESLLQSYGITEPEEIDLLAIAYDQGATVKYRPLKSCEARIVGQGNKAVISISSEGHPDRQRFSIAHELGHWVQDKGRVSLACSRGDIGPNRAGIPGQEAQANSFAAQILMPDYMFRPLSARQPLTLDAAMQLARRFQTSITATAIKLVKTAHYPGMLVCYTNGRLAWAMPGPDIPRRLQPVKELDDDSQAYAIWKGSTGNTKPTLQSADTWIDCEGAEDHSLIEHSIEVVPGTIVTLLWWKDEAQLRDFPDA